MSLSEQLFERAKRVMPGGVNSPVRAFNAVGGAPKFIQKAQGAVITDEDGVSYLDFVNSWGPMILGHGDPAVRQAVEQAVREGLSFGAATRREVEMAELICEAVQPIEMARMVNSGTEEPVGANMGVVLPEAGFLPGLRRLCDKHGALLIFDEVITGFRLAFGGAVEYFGVEPDLVCYGKIIGGGMPVGAYGGRREIMSCVSPLGAVYQAGTLSGNPVAMAAGLANLTQLRDRPEIYQYINRLGEKLAQGLRQALPGCAVNQIGSLVCAFFTPGPVTDFASAKQSDVDRYAAYFRYMLANGVYLAPAQFEAMFVSRAHTEADIDQTVQLARRAPGGVTRVGLR